MKRRYLVNANKLENRATQDEGVFNKVHNYWKSHTAPIIEKYDERDLVYTIECEGINTNEINSRAGKKIDEIFGLCGFEVTESKIIANLNLHL